MIILIPASLVVNMWKMRSKERKLLNTLKTLWNECYVLTAFVLHYQSFPISTNFKSYSFKSTLLAQLSEEFFANNIHYYILYIVISCFYYITSYITIYFCLCLVQKVSRVPSCPVISWYLLLRWQHACRSTRVLRHGLCLHWVCLWNWRTWSCGCAIISNNLAQVTPRLTWHPLTDHMVLTD